MTSPTVALESVVLTAIIAAKEGQKAGVSDISGAYLHAGMEGEDEVLMTLRGPLAELMALSAPEVYRDYVTMQGGKKVLYVRLQRALYGLLKSALLFYRKLCGNLKRMWFELNPYAPASRTRL